MGALIPAPYRWLAMLALAATVFATGWIKGSSQVQARWDAATGAQAVAVTTVKHRQAEVTVQVVTQYVDRLHKVREVGQTIIKEVPVYVPADSPALPGGFRVLHDAAARGEFPDTARAADAPGVAAQDLADTLAANYLTCHEIAEQLTALQVWVAQQRGIN